MAGINEIRRVNVLKILKQLKDSFGIDRAGFAELAGMNYNLLNQYLSENAKKNIGPKTAKSITQVLDIAPEWIDQIRNEYEINLILSSKFTATKPVADLKKTAVNNSVKPYIATQNHFKILPISKKMYLYRGKTVEITENEIIEHSIEIPSSLIDPLAFEIVGSGYNKPYLNGFVIICDRAIDPAGGDDVVIKTIDNKYFVGEFMYSRENNIEIMTIDGIREIVENMNIEIISTVVAYYTSRQKLPIQSN